MKSAKIHKNKRYIPRKKDWRCNDRTHDAQYVKLREEDVVFPGSKTFTPPLKIHIRESKHFYSAAIVPHLSATMSQVMRNQIFT